MVLRASSATSLHGNAPGSTAPASDPPQRALQLGATCVCDQGSAVSISSFGLAWLPRRCLQPRRRHYPTTGASKRGTVDRSPSGPAQVSTRNRVLPDARRHGDTQGCQPWDLRSGPRKPPF